MLICSIVFFKKSVCLRKMNFRIAYFLGSAILNNCDVLGLPYFFHTNSLHITIGQPVTIIQDGGTQKAYYLLCFQCNWDRSLYLYILPN